MPNLLLMVHHNDREGERMLDHRRSLDPPPSAKARTANRFRVERPKDRGPEAKPTHAGTIASGHMDLEIVELFERT
jgi:hypothetical protein